MCFGQIFPIGCSLHMGKQIVSKSHLGFLGRVV
jgi:hypothetical protein